MLGQKIFGWKKFWILKELKKNNHQKPALDMIESLDCVSRLTKQKQTFSTNMGKWHALMLTLLCSAFGRGKKVCGGRHSAPARKLLNLRCETLCFLKLCILKFKITCKNQGQIYKTKRNFEIWKFWGFQILPEIFHNCNIWCKEIDFQKKKL